MKNCDRDYQANHIMAQEYYYSITAPKKGMFIMEDTGHMSPMYRSEELSGVVHEIAEEIYG